MIMRHILGENIVKMFLLSNFLRKNLKNIWKIEKGKIKWEVNKKL
jgi:hypothetical protein